MKAIALGGYRIGALWSDGKFYVKEGKLNATWVLQATGIVKIALAGNRIGVLGSEADKRFRVKQGTLQATWSLMAVNAKEIALT